MITFNTDGILPQNFSFPAPIMDYIFKNVQPQHLIKLYPTCKFFYAKYRRNIIRHLEIVSDGEPQIFDPTKSVICISNPALDKLHDFWITDSLTQRGPAGNYTLYSHHFTVKKLELRDYISWVEFELLTKAGTVEELKIKGVYRSAVGFLPIENILSRVPNASSIEISESIITPTTFELLLSSNHKAKISNLVLKNITPRSSFTNKYRLFVDFLFKNVLESCNVHIDFKKRLETNDEWREINERIEEIGKDYCELIIDRLKLKFEAQKIAHAKSMLNP